MKYLMLSISQCPPKGTEYADICSVMAHRDWDLYSWLTVPYKPHFVHSMSEDHSKKYYALMGELGQRALDTLRVDFETSEEGFPVPETYYLAAALCHCYLKSGQYEKCASIFDKGTAFDEAFNWWPLEELQEYEWFLAFMEWSEMAARANGLLEGLSKGAAADMRESQQRMELQLLKVLYGLEKLSKIPRTEETEAELLEGKPWLVRATNLGSLVNAETLYHHLRRKNWGEVISGYANAIEEELKPIYETYLSKQNCSRDKGALSDICTLLREKTGNAIWKNFVILYYPQHKEFLMNDFPDLVTELFLLRGPASHGRMKDSQSAERARGIVFGKDGKPGLLQELMNINNRQRPAIS